MKHLKLGCVKKLKDKDEETFFNRLSTDDNNAQPSAKEFSPLEMVLKSNFVWISML